MRTFDLAPLYRSTVGFDRLANVLDRAMTTDVSTSTYPPYNIEKSGENEYRISVAVAGFTDEELSVELREGQLVISASKAVSADEEQPEVNYLHRGIAARAFEKRFQLADHMRATAAETKNGLLHIDLVREVPEALKPRRIEISGAKAAPKKAKKAALTHDA